MGFEPYTVDQAWQFPHRVILNSKISSLLYKKIVFSN